MKTNANLKQLILAVSVSLLAFPLISTVAFAKSQGDKSAENKASETGCKQEVGDNTSGKVNQACRDIITNNIYKSIEYKEIQQEIVSLEQGLKTAQNRAEKYPDDTSFQNDLITIGKKLADKRKQLVQFKKEITKLYNDLQKIPNDNKRLKKAKALFNEGKFREARVFLEEEESSMRGEQEALLKQKDTTQKQLQNNAEEYITLAKLTAIDYSLKDQRIPKTRAYFRQALKSNHSPNNLFKYARFLQENNLFKASEKHYREALKHYRQLAKDNAGVYKPRVAETLNNLANLIGKDSHQRGEAETLYQEALKYYRQLVKDNAGVYLSEVANTSGAMGLAYLQWGQNNKALPLLREATKILHPLAKKSPGVYAEKQALFLMLLAIASDQENEQCKASREALGLTQNNQWIEKLQGIKKKSCQ